MKKIKKNNIISNILPKLSPEEQKLIDEKIERQIKWFDEHPDYNARYGTDKSYWLQEIIEAGFKPVGITIMICEETIIMETTEEIEKAWEIFKPEGWWYTVEEFQKVRNDYVNKTYSGNYEKAPHVYCLNNKYKNIIKNGKI